MLRTLIPIGVASMSFTDLMPGASIAFTCEGLAPSPVSDFRAGIRLSSTSVVFPDPETPVTAMRRPFGKSTAAGFTVCIPVVSRWIRPRLNIPADGVLGLTGFCALPERNGAILDFAESQMSERVPSATILPPFSPEPGPISMNQSAHLRIPVS